MRAIFVGPEGIRAGWRFLLFLVLLLAIGAALGWTSEHVIGVSDRGGWTPGLFLVVETLGGLGIIATLAAAAVMGRVEKRTLRDYGFPPGRAFGSLFWQGILWGFLAIAALVLLIGLAGGVAVRGLALSGRALLSSALLWALAMTALGLAEEFLFRGYPLAALADGMGFWPAAVVLSLVFGALHYFGKPMETWIDGISVTLIAIFLCLTLRRTGDLWFAIGFHAAFDYAALALFASPNSGNGGRAVNGHLLAVAYRGPDWLTGGSCGIEASAFVFVVIGALFFLLDRRFREPRFPVLVDRGSSG